MNHILLTHTNNGYIGAVTQGKCPIVTYAPRQEFIQFVMSLKEDFPTLKQVYVVDDKIRQIIENKIMFDKKIIDCKSQNSKNDLQENLQVIKGKENENI